MTREMKVFSYVVDHDHGTEPNPYGGTCTLCECKFSHKTGHRNIVELAQLGDWIIGTGGNSKDSSGHGKLVYAMEVTEIMPRADFYRDRRFSKKITHVPADAKNMQDRFALISEHFYYFGKDAPEIEGFNLEKNSRGFHYVDQAELNRLLQWLEQTYKRGKAGGPTSPSPAMPKRCDLCKLSCSE